MPCSESDCAPMLSLGLLMRLQMDIPRMPAGWADVRLRRRGVANDPRLERSTETFSKSSLPPQPRSCASSWSSHRTPRRPRTAQNERQRVASGQVRRLRSGAHEYTGLDPL